MVKDIKYIKQAQDLVSLTSYYYYNNLCINTTIINNGWDFKNKTFIHTDYIITLRGCLWADGLREIIIHKYYIQNNKYINESIWIENTMTKELRYKDEKYKLYDNTLHTCHKICINKISISKAKYIMNPIIRQKIFIKLIKKVLIKLPQELINIIINW